MKRNNSIEDIRARSKASRERGPVKYRELLKEAFQNGTGPEDLMTEEEINFFSRQYQLPL